MTFIGLALRDLIRRPARSIFTLLGVALAVASFLTLNGLARGMSDGASTALRERGVDLVVSRRGMIEVFGGALPQALEREIRAIPGVHDVSCELLTFLELENGVQAIVAGWNADGFAFREMPLSRGRLPKPGASEVVLGDSLAETLHADVGSQVTLNFETFKVVGIAKFGSGLLRGLAVMPLSDLQNLLTQPGKTTDFQVRLAAAGPAELARASEAINRLRPDLSVSTSDSASGANKAVEMLAASSLAIGAVAMLMAALSVLNTLAMVVEERVREIGILASIGWSRGRVLLLIVVEGVALAFAGGVLGIVAGHFGADALTMLVLPGTGLSAATTITLSVEAMLAALAIGAFGALWPALRASGLSPSAALRRQ